MRIHVKVFGLPRSGTNYLRWLIEHNFANTATHQGVCWEHSYPMDRKRVGRYVRRRDKPAEREIVTLNGRGQTALEATEGMTRIVVCKDREHWLQSLERARRRRYGTSGMIAKNFALPPETLWGHWHAAWAPHARFIRYESFLSAFEGSMDYLGSLLGAQPASYVTPDSAGAPIPESPQWEPQHRNLYL